MMSRIADWAAWLVAPTLPAVPGIDRTTIGFRRELMAVASRLGIKADYLAAVIAFESAGTFRPDIRNRSSGATGLIQFLPSTASQLGTDTQRLAAMTAQEQLRYVEAYYTRAIRARGQLESLADCYLVVLTGSKAPRDGVLFDRDGNAYSSAAYARNAGLDLNRDGIITADEAVHRIQSLLTNAASKPRIDTHGSHPFDRF